MVTTMADFPPTPEDGELWLPSEIIHEITSANVTVSPPKHTLLPPPPPPPPPVHPNFKICFGSFGVNQNGVRPELAVNPPPFSFYNPITPVVQGFEEKGSMVYVEKYGGTGVFLPLPRSCAVSKKKPEEIGSNPGVATQKKEKLGGSGKEEEGSNEERKWSSMKKENLEKKEYYSQLPSGICLPQDWTY